MKTGIYEQTNEVYHSGPGYSSTNLIDLIQYSESHMKYWKENPQEPTGPMIEGSMLHTKILEPHLFEKQYFVADARTTAGKLLIEANKDKKRVTQDQMEKIQNMSEAALKNMDMEHILKTSEMEKSFYWNDPDTGLLCKCRPDFFNLDRGIIVDIKTIDNGTLWNVKRAIRDYKYYLSASLYMDGVNQVLGKNVIKDFLFIFIEKSEPFGVRKAILSLNDLQKGFDEYKEALTRIKKCEDTGVWPGYDTSVIELNVFQEVVK